MADKEPKVQPDRWTFSVDDTDRSEGYFYVDVAGLGTVAIKVDDEGIVVDVYPLQVVAAPVASTYALTTDLKHEPDLERDREQQPAVAHKRDYDPDLDL